MITGYDHTTLDNGIEVVSIERPTESMMVAAFVRVGGAHETREQAGLSHYLEHMAFKGTSRHTGDEINEMVEVAGANVNAFTANFETAFLFTGLKEHEMLGLDTVAEIVLESNFPEEELENERMVIQQEMDQYEVDPGHRHSRIAHEIAFPEQARGRPIIGFPDALNFSRDEIAGWMASHLNGENLVICQSGPFRHDAFTARVDKLFSHIPRGIRSKPQSSRFAPSELKHVDEFDLSGQAIMSVVMPLPKQANDEEHRVASRLSLILSGGMTSPLFRIVRENAGLCYSIESHIGADPDESLLSFETQCRSENVEKVRELMLRELDRVANGDISDMDWTRASNMLQNSVRLIREMDHITVAMPIVQTFIHKGVMTTHDEIVEKHMKTTREEVVELAKSLREAVKMDVITI